MASQIPSSTVTSRLTSVDIVRGLVMALMALDHARVYLVNGDPTNLDTTTLGLFLTRWITHLCAPAFVLLAGVSAFLVAQRDQMSAAGLSRRLIVRGLGLIVLDVAVLPVLWWFTVDFRFIVLGVLWAIGWSMIALALCTWLNRSVIGAIGLSMTVLHNATDAISSTGGPPLLSGIWSVLHVPAAFELAGRTVYVGYPLIPWIGVMMCGYWLGQMLIAPVDHRRRGLILLGSILIFGFGLLRAVNIYGDPNPWSLQSDSTKTVISFLNCTKYPPSLSYLLMTCGPTVLLLGLLDSSASRWTKPLSTLGRSPLFFYLLHIPVVHGIAVVMSLVEYGRAEWWFRNPPFPGMPEDYGWGLPVLYVVWLLVLAGLTPVCSAYRQWRCRPIVSRDA